MATHSTIIPNWTVLYDLTSSEGFVSRVREFFTSNDAAQKRYDELSANNQMPTKRLYHFSDEMSLAYHTSQL